jgi:hypothetical protein
MRALGFLLVSVVVLAGCTTSTPSDVQPTAPVASGPAQYSDTTGAIEGFVTDEEIQPVADAEVGLLQLPDQRVRTDAQGRFAFSNLDPGRYTVAVQKLGYTAAATSVDVVVGETKLASIVLSVLPIQVPYPELIIHRGIIENGVGVVRTATCTNCGTDETRYHFPDGAIAADWQAIMIEVVWNTQDFLGIDFVDRNDDATKAAAYWRIRSASPVHGLVLRGGDYTGAPHYARQPMPIEDEAFDGDGDNWYIEDWYVGSYQTETHSLDTVCQTDIPNPAGGANLLNGYKAGCYGLGFIPELTFTNYITIFHLEVPGDAETYSAIPDA